MGKIVIRSCFDIAVGVTTGGISANVEVGFPQDGIGFLK